MLTVCLHKLCVKDSFANALRKVEKCVNIIPGGVENLPREGPKWPLGGEPMRNGENLEIRRQYGSF